uniref:Secreted protein n=1 Tax=Romanomermis culicivorax TaxID=13658 RepID=A0A915IPB4_ROMCU
MMITKILSFLICCSVIYCAIDTDQYPSQAMDLRNPYTSEMLQDKIQYFLDRNDERKNFDTGSPNVNSRKLIKIESATMKSMGQNGDLYNATIFIGDRSCDSGPESMPTFSSASSSCGVRKNGTFQKCWVEIWNRPFESFSRDTMWQCQNVDRQTIYG